MPSTMDILQKRSKKKRETILKELEEYPHSFRLKDVIRETKDNAFEALRKDLVAGLTAGYHTSVQTATNRNLLAFVLFQLGNRREAVRETEEVLKMNDQQNNIVSLANKAFMLSDLCSFDDAEEAVEELRELRKTKEMDYLLVKAKAELAASYMRFGPRFNMHAADAFNEVLPQAREPEVWLWRLWLAITYRRALDLQHAPVPHGKHVVTHEKALALLRMIVDSKPPTGASANLKANANVAMALLLRLAWNKTTKYQLCSQVETGPLLCCKKALELDDNDATVLWIAGKLFRNYRDLPRSKRLLEKAVSLQPSSPAFHNLGLTFKAMATNVQHGKKKTRRGGKREQRRKSAMAVKVKFQKLDGCSGTQRVLKRGQTQQDETVTRLGKAVKSPSEVTQFDLHDGNVQNAIANLKKALEFSAEENSRAAYDLALMHVATKNDNEALEILETIVQRQSSKIANPSGFLDQITALEQMGLIYKRKADEELDEEKKGKLTKKKERLSNDALCLMSQLYSKSNIKDIFGEVFSTPYALLKDAEASDCSEEEKQKKKAGIFSSINNFRECHAALDDIAEEARDTEYYKLKIQAFARNGEYRNAVTTMSSLKHTEQYDEVMELCDQEDSVYSSFDIYFEAGKESLLDSTYITGHFIAAFRRAVPPPYLQTEENSSTSDDEPSNQGAAFVDTSSDNSGLEGLFDVMLLHDDEDDDIENKAVGVSNILKKACGLEVVRRIENFPYGSEEMSSVLKNIEKSRVVVVMPGEESRTNVFERCITAVASRGTTVVLLTPGVGPEAIPLVLKKTARQGTCPPELLAPDLDLDGPYTEDTASAVCQLFKFLANRE
ncbi:uncharacterized protein LOC143300165 isoform X2 [Babylonia areolata]|uniref:uncharacterized protein LOC143300165 isoform X2 n=1 Tax=Babylonia areolata TaxID=304850 RepID=UPI003FD3B8C4